MAGDPVFGEITLVPAIEQAVLVTLQTYSPTYLREMERRTGRDFEALPDVASWRATDDLLDRFPEQQLPAVQLQCTTDIDLTTRAQDIVAGIRGTIDVVVQSNEAEAARELASIYAFSLGLIIAQNPALDKSVKCIGTGWEKMTVPEVGKLKASSRWLAFGSATIVLAIEGFASPLMGPEEPQVGETPPPMYPEVTSHKLTVELEDKDA
jgi:hypothetical protein